jgi:radical SAM protein with 4Fe4S-binding SPASM domain
MSDKYAIDSHKLSYHPLRVAQWLDAKDDMEKLKKIYPIYIEISPVGACNHRCTFCAVDYIGYKNVRWERDVLKTRLSEMSKKGVKSVMFAGEGEPLLHKELDDIIEHCANIDIDSSIATNLVLLNEKNVDKIIKHTSWIKVSINAGTRDTYSQIHTTKKEDFDTVLKNMKLAVKTKKQNNYKCTLGAQMLLLPENKHEALTLAKLVKEIGFDYLVIKPYSQHLFSETKIYKDIDYKPMLELDKELNKLNDDNFNVVFRSNTMKKLDTGHAYKTCYSTPNFWAYLMANGDLYGCSAYLQQDEFCYGNLKEDNFEDVWEGEKRQKSITFVKEKLDISGCRANCRMDEVNTYLWRLKHPQAHDSFI